MMSIGEAYVRRGFLPPRACLNGITHTCTCICFICDDADYIQGWAGDAPVSNEAICAHDRGELLLSYCCRDTSRRVWMSRVQSPLARQCSLLGQPKRKPDRHRVMQEGHQGGGAIARSILTCSRAMTLSPKPCPLHAC
jgi:hypothetical protein